MREAGDELIDEDASSSWFAVKVLVALVADVTEDTDDESTWLVDEKSVDE